MMQRDDRVLIIMFVNHCVPGPIVGEIGQSDPDHHLASWHDVIA